MHFFLKTFKYVPYIHDILITNITDWNYEHLYKSNKCLAQITQTEALK